MSTVVLQSSVGGLYEAIPLIIIVSLFILLIAWALDIVEGGV